MIRFLFIFFLIGVPIQASAVSLNGTVFLSAGFADSDIELVVQVLELSASDSSIQVQTDSSVIITQGTGSANYSVDFPEVSNPNNVFTVRYLCTLNTCGRFVPEAYYNIQGSSQFFFDGNAIIPSNQLPSNINFSLAVGSTLSGTIFLPRQTNRDIEVNAVAQFVPETVSTAFQSFFPNQVFLIPAGSTQVDFLVEGIPPILARLLPFAGCFNCEDEFSVNAFTANFDSNNPFATTFPADQNNTGIELFFELGSNPPSPPASNTLPPIINLLLDGG